MQDTNAETNSNTKTLSNFLVLVFLFISILIACYVVSSLTNRSNTSVNNRPIIVQPPTDQTIDRSVKQTSARKEGDVISGVGRIELETKYNAQKDLSDIKGKSYAESIKGQSVTWIAKVTDVTEEIFGNDYLVSLTMNGYSVTVRDRLKEFGSLSKNEIVQVTGTIEKLVDVFGGVDIYLENAKVEVL